MSTLLQDVKYALRGLIKRPGFTIVAVLSLALGVGANTAIFTVINAVFLHPLAIDEPQRVVESFTRDTQTVQAAGFALTPSSLQNYVDYRDRNSAFSGLAAYFQNGFQWTRSGETTGVRGMLTTANYFDVLGVKPALGRFFSPDEDLDHAVPVAVISHSVWLTQFGGDRAALGQSMTLNNLSFTIIGVAADGFKGTQSLAGPDCIWIPLGMRDQILTGQIKSLMTNRRFRWVNIIGRLKPAVSLAQADASMKTIAASLAQEFPDANRGRTIDLAPVSDAALGINNRQQFVSIGTVMMTVVGLVLLIS
jgi:ABC-type antimicrobial peptide transport system permease subunit